MPDAGTNAGVWDDPKNVDLLKSMWAEGASGTEIARAIGQGATRNAVTGKVHRLRLASHGRNDRVTRNTTPAVSGKKGRSGNPGVTSVRSILHRVEVRRQREESRQRAELQHSGNMPFRDSVLPPDDEGVDCTHMIGLLQLNDHTCKWPHGDPHDPAFGFCGREPLEGKPYCGEHDRRAHRPAIGGGA